MAMVFNIHDGEAEEIRFIYYSLVSLGLTKLCIKDILANSRMNNVKLGVTGLLFLNRRYFFQVVEGKRGAVNRIMRKIYTDKRHYDVTVMSVEPAASRHWVQWSMAWLEENAVSQQLCRRFCGDEVFRPDRMNASQAKAFSEHFSSSGTALS